MIENGNTNFDLIKTSEIVKEAIDDEIVGAAKRIKEQVNAFIAPYQGVIPQKFDIQRFGGELGGTGGYVENYPEYDVETGELNEVIEEYFMSGVKPSIIHKRTPLPITSWIQYGHKIIDRVTGILSQQKH